MMVDDNDLFVQLERRGNYDLFLPVISHTDYLFCLHHYNYHITEERDSLSLTHTK